MNIEQLNAFKKREELIKLIQDDNQRKIELEKLENEKTECYKDCYVKTSQRIKNSEQLLEKLNISVASIGNDVKALTLTVTEKAKVYDQHIEELDNQKEQRKGMRKLWDILRLIISCGGGMILLKVLENWSAIF